MSNHCDGCNAGLEFGKGLSKNIHFSSRGPEMVCQKYKYSELPIVNPDTDDKSKILDFLKDETNNMYGNSSSEWLLESGLTVKIMKALLIQRAEYGETGNKEVDDVIESVYSDLIEMVEGGEL